MILRLSGVEEVMSYTLSLPSHDAVTYRRSITSKTGVDTVEALTRYFPEGSHVADLTGLALSDNNDWRDVSFT
jgi:hypothetical protein